MALDRGLQLWRLWGGTSHHFNSNHCLELIVLKSLINVTRLEAVEELWSLIVGYERHEHLSPSSKRIPVTKRYVNYTAQKCDDHGQRLGHCTQKDLKYY